MKTKLISIIKLLFASQYMLITQEAKKGERTWRVENHFPHSQITQSQRAFYLTSNIEYQSKLHWAIRLRKRLLIRRESKWNAVMRDVTAWLEVNSNKK